MSKLMTQANNNFCVLNAQSVCDFARVDHKVSAQNLVQQTYNNIQTSRVFGGGVKPLPALAFSLQKGKGGDAMCP